MALGLTLSAIPAVASFPAQFELSSLDGTNGFVLNGDSADRSGFSVAAAGDVNSDGFQDLIIGALSADPNGRDSGESYVVFGGAGLGAGGSLELSTLDGSNGFVLNGIDPQDYSGVSVASAGDVNGDGIADLIIGASDADPAGMISAGESYVVFGGAGLGAGGSLELSALDGTNGFVLNGINTNDASGRSVAGAGDVNGDTVDDLIIGAPYADPNGQLDAGESYVVFGGTGLGTGGTVELSALDGTNGFVLNGIDPGDLSGRSVAGVGDVDGNGVDDLMIGASRADPNGGQSGESYVVFGGVGLGATGSLELSSLDGTDGFVLNGINTEDYSGVSVAGSGDLNGDGVEDLVIGAYGANNGVDLEGESYVVFGGGTGLGAGGSLELSDLNGSNGFVLNGFEAGSLSGGSVAGVGDVNGDGIEDLLIGASLAPYGGPPSGASYVVFGRRAPICSGFEATIVGTDGDDDIVGTVGADVIYGSAGNDTIRGLGDDDIICGGYGEDSIYGNTGDDSLFGEEGDDALFGGSGNDRLDGGDKADRLFGGSGDDEVRGGLFDDALFGQDGRDLLFGDEGRDRLFGGDNNDKLVGGSENDHLFGQAGNDQMDGGAAFDRCNGNGGNGDTARRCERLSSTP